MSIFRDLLFLVLAVVFVKLIFAYRKYQEISSIPTVGPSGFFTSYLGARRFLTHSREIVQEGYVKYPGRVFKVPLLDRWLFVISGKAMYEEMKSVPPDVFSLTEAAADTLQANYTIGPQIVTNHYHVHVIRNQLTRNIAARFPDVQDEIHLAFMDMIPATTDWSGIACLKTVQHIVSRTSNRFFVGEPICRDPDYISLNIDYAIVLFKTGRIIGILPDVFKPIAARFFVDKEALLQRCIKHVGALIQERLDKDAEHDGNDWPGRPNDLISWLLSEATEDERNVRALALRVLVVNAVSVHTTSAALAMSLFQLASHPELVPELRNEVESIVQEEGGWTKPGMAKMRRLDSFLKESARIYQTKSKIGLKRHVKKDFRFSDGTLIPAGSWLAYAVGPESSDEELFNDASKFNSTRYYDARLDPGQSIKHQMITPTYSYTIFGSGRNACPGRFFAVNELKSLMGYILLHYDVKLEVDEEYTDTAHKFVVPSQDRDRKIFFRARQ